jgi:hypothetical protein
MSSVRKIHRKNLVTGIEKSEKRRKVSVSSTVRLHVCVISSPKLACTLTGDILYLVNELTTAIVTLAGITLSILICENSARCKKNCLGNDILGRDKLDVAALSAKLSAASGADFGIELFYSFKKHIMSSWKKY